MMMNRKKVAYIFILLALILNAGIGMQAQDKVLIRGKVSSQTDGEALVAVSVSEVDKDNRTIMSTQTDMNGEYSLKITAGASHKLIFSYIGFKSKTLSIGAAREVNCQLEDDSRSLNEVMIVSRKKMNNGMLSIAERDVTTAYSKIDASEVENLPATSIDEALQGRMAGVDIVTNSGEPGAGTSIRVRGITSINSSSDPLIVINGVPYDETISSDFDFSTADEDSYSQLLNISPSDIADIVVLKDAASCALYGNRGANGVILITTKRGSMGKPKIGYTFKGSWLKMGNSIPTLTGDEYVSLVEEEYQNSGTPINLVSYPQFARDPNNPYYYYNYGQNTDWVKALTQTGFTQEHNVSISGGGDKALYRMSVGYLDQSGTVIGQGYKRYTTTFNLNYNVSERLRVTADLSFTHGVTDKNYMADLLSSAYTKMPNQSIYEWTDTGVETSNYFSPASTPQGSFLTANMSTNKYGIYNPVAMANEGYWTVTSDRVRPNFVLQYALVPDRLTYYGNVAFDMMSEKTKKFLPQIATGLPWTSELVNRATDIDEEAFIIQTFNTLTYTPDLGENHVLSLMGRVSTYDKSAEYYSVVASNTSSTEQTDASNGGNIISSTTSHSQQRTFSALFQAQYSLLDRYVFNATARMDGDSKFNKDNRYGYFPSLSARWRMSSEKFLKDKKFIDDLSLRVSYGQNGNTPDDNYLYYGKYSTYAYTYLGQKGTYASSMALENLKWEIKSEYNLGFNFVGFDNRINIDFNWYTSRTRNLYFEDVNIPTSSGYSTINMNVGTVDNRGWEFNMTATPYKNKDWRVNFRMNFAHSENVIRKLSDNVSTSSTPTASNGTFLGRIQVGNPLGSFYGYRYKGVYLNQDETIARDKNGDEIYTYANGVSTPVQMKFWYPTVGYEFQPGDAKYEDINHDGNINSQDIVYLGNANPDLTGGFGPSIKYKQWSVDAYFYFRYGCDVVNSTKMDMESMYDFDNQSRATLRRWKHSYASADEAPSDLLPRALFKSGYNWLGSDRYVESGSFLRWQNLTVKYDFSKKLISQLGLSTLSVNCVLYNIYIWTKYTGMDPEISFKSLDDNIYQIGYDTSKAPRSQTFTLGLNLSF